MADSKQRGAQFLDSAMISIDQDAAAADISKLPRARLLERVRRSVSAYVSSWTSWKTMNTETRLQNIALALLAVFAFYFVVDFVRSLPTLFLSSMKSLYSSLQGILNEGIDTLPPEIKPYAKGALMTFLATSFASAPPAALYYVYRVYMRLRYLNIQVPENSEVFAWITM
jgi:predicted neutral ceramidase superfamily lipid hydrolase